MLMFLDEMEMTKRIKNRKKIRKENQKVINLKKEDEKEEQNDYASKAEKEIMNKDSNQSKDIMIARESNRVVNSIELSNEKNGGNSSVYENIKINIWDLKNNNNNLISQLLNKINMGNNVSKELGDIKANIFLLIDEKEESKEKIASLEGENPKLKENMENTQIKIDKLSNDNDNLKVEVENLKNNCEELKEMIGDIQCRYLSKNFLNCFKSYLTQNDNKQISEGKISKGEAILKYIGIIYSEVNKKI